LLSVLLISAAGVCSAPEPGRDSQSGPQFVALPLGRSRQNHLLVRAFINGKPALLGVDTGAPISAIAIRRREHFKLTEIPTSSNLPAQIDINGALDRLALARSFRLGALVLVDQPIVTIDLSGSTRAAHLLHEQEIDGILGADILFPMKAVLDCQREVLILKLDSTRTGPIPGIEYRGLRHMPIQVSDGQNLYVDGAVNGAPAKLMIDTGAFATLLHRDFVRQMRIPLRQTRLRSAAVNLKQRGLAVATIRRLSVGSVDIVGNEVGVVNLQGLIHDDLLNGSPPVAGLLGAEILKAHHAIVDFGTRTLYLKR
jgi:predicted aspartyl protease